MVANKRREKSTTAREIGPLPPIADPARRARCRNSLRQFCETYNPAAFDLGWSGDHLKAITRIEEAATQGALYAFAMARGSGKTAICRHAALWALAYAHIRYGFIIGATGNKAVETLDAIRKFVRFLPLFVADFPEIAYPVQRLEGIAQRATGQTCGGEPTLAEWAGEKIVFPTVAPPANWPAHWPLRADGMVPTSGGVLAASGLTAEGLRGSLLTLSNGGQVRPDLVLLDDPQTGESARSLTQNETRLNLIMADVLGMAGPGRSIAAVMPCTVVERGDMVDRILDRTKHPLWRGERSGMLRSMPTDLAAWDRYFEIFAHGAQQEPPDHSEATAYYLAHRAELEAGSVASWEDRKEPWEVSAIQSAMHLYFRDPRAFWAEYMNQPMDSNPAAAGALTSEEVLAKVSNLARGIIPRSTTRLTAFVDVGAHLLWSTTIGWDERFGGSIVDVGAYPEQTRSYFTRTDARPALEDVEAVRGRGLEAAVYAGLTAIVARVFSAHRQEETGAEMRVERCLIDANYGPLTDLVYEFCRRSPYAGQLIPSHGKFIGASSNPMASWAPKPGERTGEGWRLLPPSGPGRGRHVVFDTNHWKTFLTERIRTPEGAAGCLRIFAAGPDKHQLLVDHLTAEYPVEVARTGGRAVHEWKLKPNRGNDWFDCVVGAAVAASITGITWSAGTAAGEGQEPRKQRKRIDIEELYAQARASNGAQGSPQQTAQPRKRIDPADAYRKATDAGDDMMDRWRKANG